MDTKLDTSVDKFMNRVQLTKISKFGVATLDCVKVFMLKQIFFYTCLKGNSEKSNWF